MMKGGAKASPASAMTSVPFRDRMNVDAAGAADAPQAIRAKLRMNDYAVVATEAARCASQA